MKRLVRLSQFYCQIEQVITKLITVIAISSNVIGAQTAVFCTNYIIRKIVIVQCNRTVGCNWTCTCNWTVSRANHFKVFQLNLSTNHNLPFKVGVFTKMEELVTLDNVSTEGIFPNAPPEILIIMFNW